MEIDAFLATRVRDLRRERGFTLDELARASGVSRSMISLIERQETSPTAAVLNKLADAFGLSLPALFAGGAEPTDPDPLSRRARQPVWTDPASGYLRRRLSPAGGRTPIELVEIVFPPGQTVLFDNPLRLVDVEQQVWIIKGSMVITHGGHSWRLQAGDCMAMTLGEHITFHNPGPHSARYLLATARSISSARKPQ